MDNPASRTAPPPAAAQAGVLPAGSALVCVPEAAAWRGVERRGGAVTGDGFVDEYSTYIDAIERHFRAEERLMEDVHAPGLRTHREQHARVLAGLHHALGAAYLGDTAQARRAVVLFPQWLALHRVTMDAALAWVLHCHGLPWMMAPGSLGRSN